MAVDRPGSDFDLMRDVYMTKTQREAFERIMYRARTADPTANACLRQQWVEDPDTIPPEIVAVTKNAIALEFGIRGTAGYYKRILRAMLRANPAARLECVRNLVAIEKGEPRERRQKDVKASTTRFMARVSAEVERMLDYKQSDFVKALAAVPPAELKGFRANLALLLDSIDRASEKRNG